MAKLIAAMLLLAYTSISAVNAGNETRAVPVASGVPDWYDGPAVPGMTKYCLAQPLERLPSGEQDRLFKNKGACSCTEAKLSMQMLKQTAGGEDVYIPECDESGKWKRKQTTAGGAFCVDENGNQVTKFKTGEVVC